MTGTGLVFILMPIIVPIGLAVLIALPFLAARNPSQAIASDVPAGADDFSVTEQRDSGKAVADTQPSPANQASPDPA
jgi:predicted lipid-binding transport protein (Tim44 family)